jgi:hypothetical protein
MNEPDIKTAIPKRRYRLGEFTVVILGEVESGGGVDYGYITAVVREGDPKPGIYITAERDSRDARAGELALRLIMRDGEQMIGTLAQGAGIERFADESLRLISTILNLSDEQPYRLM